MIKTGMLNEISSQSSDLQEFMTRQYKNRPINVFESHADKNLMCIDWVDVKTPDMKPVQLVVCQSSDDLLFLCESKKLLETVKKTLKELEQATLVCTTCNDGMLIGFLSKMMRNDEDSIEKIEDKLADIEDTVFSEKKYIDDISKMSIYRKKVRGLRKYYDQMLLVSDGLCDNENNLVSEAECIHAELLYDRIKGLVGNVRDLREYTSQIGEAYQSRIGIEQNNIMKTFTIISGIFLPLSLLVGWYGMNFKNMKELNWNYGYLAVTIMSVCIVLICLMFFKKKKWM
ncbi:MAG: hypothetical protein KBA87_04665 [Lachnospiraceae bacterium]|jgi:magnesium transporter|nr:hypothetical protein [Lachnospiraceae bacterium]